MSTIEKFSVQLELRIDRFVDNALLKTIEQGDFTIPLYHRLLLALLQQVKSSSETFMLAADQLRAVDRELSDYLARHSHDEREHWRWIVNDLEETGYSSAMPDFLGAPPQVQAYVAYNHHVARHFPIGRLGIAAYLEGLGGRYSRSSAGRVAQTLSLKADQMQFFLGHAETDAVHSQEILNLLKSSHLSAEDCVVLDRASETAAYLYTDIYEAIVQAR